jgi:hypothetical protein
VKPEITKQSLERAPPVASAAPISIAARILGSLIVNITVSKVSGHVGVMGKFLERKTPITWAGRWILSPAEGYEKRITILKMYKGVVESYSRRHFFFFSIHLFSA